MSEPYLSLSEAATRFLANLSPENRGLSQQEVYRFVRWYGWERPVAGLTAPEVARYAEQLSRSDTDYNQKLELTRAFLIHAKQAGWMGKNLATNLRVRKGKTAPVPGSRRGSVKAVPLTAEGYAKLEAELTALKARRTETIAEVRRAAADKDFRENAPLEAARQEHGRLEGRIREIEAALKSAVIIAEKEVPAPKVGIGDRIILCDLASGEELHYTMVSPREVDPSQGKISSLSPIGKAVFGRRQGETVEVTVPVGKLRYQIKQIGH